MKGISLRAAMAHNFTQTLLTDRRNPTPIPLTNLPIGDFNYDAASFGNKNFGPSSRGVMSAKIYAKLGVRVLSASWLMVDFRRCGLVLRSGLPSFTRIPAFGPQSLSANHSACLSIRRINRHQAPKPTPEAVESHVLSIQAYTNRRFQTLSRCNNIASALHSKPYPSGFGDGGRRTTLVAMRLLRLPGFAALHKGFETCVESGPLPCLAGVAVAATEEPQQHWWIHFRRLLS